MRNTLNVGAKVGFLNNKNKFEWSKVISFGENDNVTLKQNNKYGYEFTTSIKTLLDGYKRNVIKIVSNCKNY